MYTAQAIHKRHVRQRRRAKIQQDNESSNMARQGNKQYTATAKQQDKQDSETSKTARQARQARQ